MIKKALTLEGKIKLLDANKERKQNYWQLAERFNIGEMAAANIKGQFNDIYEILHEWFKKCCAANI